MNRASIFSAIFFSCLLNGFLATAQAQVGLEGISSGRYEIRSVKSRKPASVVQKRSISAETQEKTAPEQPVVPSLSVPPKIQEPSFTEQAQGLFSEKTEKYFDYYRVQTNGEDPRTNRLELDVKPVFTYNDSSSNYSYRNYSNFFNGLQLNANVWFMPMIGVTGKLMFSLAADVDGMSSNRSRIPAKYELMDLGLTFRNFFGSSIESKSLEVALLYSENKFLPSLDNQARARLKSQGIGLSMKMRLPSSAEYAWVIGGSVFPRLQHVETQPMVDVGAGANDENIRLGIEFGGEWILNRANQITWNLGATTERNIFVGSANRVDASTGQTPANVSVTNSMYMFSLGYRWGN